jgi:ferredoxin
MLFDAACRAGLPVASSCSAEAVCGKCVMKIHSGAENLNQPTEHERKLLLREKRTPSERISCMVLVQGDCTVSTSYW